MRKYFFTLILIFCVGNSVLAGGYRVALQGVRQAAMGITSSMHARDASVAFYNPAGIAFIDSKFSIAAGGFMVFSKIKWQDQSTLDKAETDNPMGTPMYFAATYRPIEEITLGLSVSTPFGNTVKWPQKWAGIGNVTKIELASYFIQPTIAFKFNDWFSIGGGLIYAIGQVKLDRTMAIAGNDIDLQIDEDGTDHLGYNIGVFVRPSDKLNIGLAYRSPIDMKAELAEAKWTNVPSGLSGQMPFKANAFNATLPLPSEFTAGFSYQFTPKFMLAAEISVNFWNRYESLDITLVNKESGETYESKSTKNFKNRAVYRIGGEYTPTDDLALRLGYYYDQTPSPKNHWSPETPSADLHVITAGAGYRFWEKFYLDAYWQYSIGVERKVSNYESGFHGDINMNAFVFGLGLAYNFN